MPAAGDRRIRMPNSYYKYRMRLQSKMIKWRRFSKLNINIFVREKCALQSLTIASASLFGRYTYLFIDTARCLFSSGAVAGISYHEDESKSVALLILSCIAQEVRRAGLMHRKAAHQFRRALRCQPLARHASAHHHMPEASKPRAPP